MSIFSTVCGLQARKLTKNGYGSMVVIVLEQYATRYIPLRVQDTLAGTGPQGTSRFLAMRMGVFCKSAVHKDF